MKVNDDVAAMVHGVSPFPYVRESLEKLTGKCDMLVCSATPNAALKQEWEEHDIAKYVVEICGQESGNKKETLTNASKYDANCTLMIGDAPGDRSAAEHNNCLFYPINPSQEAASWERFCKEAYDLFLEGAYAGAYETARVAEFDALLPQEPPW